MKIAFAYLNGTWAKKRDLLFFSAFILIYLANLLVGRDIGIKETGEVVPLIIIFGFLFTSLAWFITRNYKFSGINKAVQFREGLVIMALLLYIGVCIVLGNRIFLRNDYGGTTGEVITLFRKVVTFVIIPFLIYRILYRFSPEDFGLTFKRSFAINSKSILIWLVFSTLLLTLNYFAGSGAKPLRDGTFSASQIIISLPFLFLWLFVEVGLVEEFFFRGLLQNRLSVLLKSSTGAILTTALVFGLVHAPGMYLRQAGLNDGLGSDPSMINSIVYCIAIQSIPGLFLGILWARTKNLWLLMGIHAMFDLLPGLPEFITVWGF